MKRILFTAVIACLLMGCGKSISGTYKMENIMPNVSGLQLPAKEKALMEGVLDAQRTVLEFGPGKKVVIKEKGMGTDATYKISGNTLKIMLIQNNFMELTIDGDTLIGPVGIKFIKQ